LFVLVVIIEASFLMLKMCGFVSDLS